LGMVLRYFASLGIRVLRPGGIVRTPSSKWLVWEEGEGGGGSGRSVLRCAASLGITVLRTGGPLRTPSFLLREEEGAGGWRFREERRWGVGR
jgi:hypothetical protein